MPEYKYPKPDKSSWGQFRDSLAYHLATFAFKRIATPWYAAMIEGSIRFGLESARREAYQERAFKLSDIPAFKKEADRGL